jgi:hypothetical protein
VVLIPGEVGQAQAGVGGDDHLADPAGAVVAVGLAVEEAQAVVGLPVLAGEPVPEDLEAGAHGQDGGTTGHCVGQRRARPQLPGGQGLGGVLAATHDVDLARPGDWLAGVDVEHLGRDVAPAEALGQHGGVAPVAVGAQQLRIEERNGDGLSHW